MRASLVLLPLLPVVAACDGLIEDPAAVPMRSVDPPGEEAAVAALVRLGPEEYRATVEALLGPEAAAVVELPALEPRHRTFTHEQLRGAAFSGSLVDRLAREAEQAVDAAFADPVRREAVVGCAPEAASDPCVGRFIDSFGRRAYRRPLTGEERAAYRALVEEVAAGEGRTADDAIDHVVIAMLQSPSLVYRVELGDDRGDRERPLTADELATRLAFALWQAPPDDALLDAAEAGRLATEAGVRAEAERMLDDPRAVRAVQRFLLEYLDARQIDSVQKDPALFGPQPPTLGASMRREVELLAEDAFRDGEDVLHLFVRRETFLNEELARVYGVDGVTGPEMRPVTIPSGWERVGILGTGAFLASHASQQEASPIRRGVLLATRVLCVPIGDPPAAAMMTIPSYDTSRPTTLRERVEQLTSADQCRGCHRTINPLGFTLEHFDALGRFRVDDHGLDIDTSGSVGGVAVEGLPAAAAALAASPAVERCFVDQAFRFTAGRLPTSADAPHLDAAGARFAAAGRTLRALLLEVVASAPFRHVRVAGGETP